MSPTPIFFEKKIKQHVIWFALILVIVVAKNLELCFFNLKTCFSIYFLPKTPIKKINKCFKLIYALKKP